MTMDQDYNSHLATWLGFTRFMKWMIAIIVIILALMAYFLV